MSTRIPNLVWLGPRGAGKQTALHNFLQEFAERLNQPFSIQIKRWQLQSSDGEGEITTSIEESSSKDETKGLAYEISRIHKGFDVARMSLQDKNYIQSILSNFKGTSNILLGEGPGASHIIVLYHAHLLSEESVILIQEVLEKFSATVSFLFTSDYPLHKRISDWFYEIPYPGVDRAYAALRQTAASLPVPNKYGQGDAWLHYFNKIYEYFNGIKDTEWKITIVDKIREWIYTCMQRNLRWCDMILYWTQVLQLKLEEPDSSLSKERAAAAFAFLAKAPMGGGFVMLPSYRIPVAWEQFMIDFLEILFEK